MTHPDSYPIDQLIKNIKDQRKILACLYHEDENLYGSRGRVLHMVESDIRWFYRILNAKKVILRFYQKWCRNGVWNRFFNKLIEEELRCHD